MAIDIICCFNVTECGIFKGRSFALGPDSVWHVAGVQLVDDE